MTFQTAIPTPASDSGEEAFGIEEIFFSRTDKRGVIQAGNAVFRRVSGFDWNKLIGAPHRIVRSPDMPKAVFHLLWKTIQQGQPIAAFVKNRTAGGNWYWVLATVIPLENGYLSARIKPTGEIFAQVKTLYAQLLEAEQTRNLTPEKSCDAMLESLVSLGFATYTDLAARALHEELALRDAALGRNNTAKVKALHSVIGNLESTRGEQEDLLKEFDALQSIPTNMRIIASRLEPSGGPISAISDNYKFASTEITRRLESFAGTDANLCQKMSDNVMEALLLAGVDRVLADLPRQFAGEDRTGCPVDFDQELNFLKAIQAKGFTAEASVAMTRAERISGNLNQASTEIRRMMLGLDTIRVMGRVESGRLGAAGAGLSSTIDQLDKRHAVIAERLQRLMDLSAAIQTGIASCRRLMEGAARKSARFGHGSGVCPASGRPRPGLWPASPLTNGPAVALFRSPAPSGSERAGRSWQP